MRFKRAYTLPGDYPPVFAHFPDNGAEPSKEDQSFLKDAISISSSKYDRGIEWIVALNRSEGEKKWIEFFGYTGKTDPSANPGVVPWNVSEDKLYLSNTITCTDGLIALAQEEWHRRDIEFDQYVSTPPDSNVLPVRNHPYLPQFSDRTIIRGSHPSVTGYFHEKNFDQAFNSLQNAEEYLKKVIHTCRISLDNSLERVTALVWSDEGTPSVDFFGFTKSTKRYGSQAVIAWLVSGSAEYMGPEITCGDGIILLGMEEQSRQTPNPELISTQHS